MSVEIDPVTGQPRGKLAPEERAAADERRVEKARAFEMALESEPGRALLDMVEKQLVERLEVVAMEDDQVRVLVNLLAAFGRKRSAARVTARSLMRRYMGDSGAVGI